jgi:hypothetical protein
VLVVADWREVRDVCRVELNLPYLISMWKFCERSAARLAVGEDPRTGFI